MLETIMGVLVGAAIGYFSCHFMEVRPLVKKVIHLRYDGFRPADDVPKKPKTVPFDMVRED